MSISDRFVSRGQTCVSLLISKWQKEFAFSSKMTNPSVHLSTCSQWTHEGHGARIMLTFTVSSVKTPLLDSKSILTGSPTWAHKVCPLRESCFKSTVNSKIIRMRRFSVDSVFIKERWNKTSRKTIICSRVTGWLFKEDYFIWI